MDIRIDAQLSGSIVIFNFIPGKQCHYYYRLYIPNTLSFIFINHQYLTQYI